MKSTTEIKNMKLHEENKPGSLQNYRAVRKLIEMLVFEIQEVEELKVCCFRAEGTQESREDDFTRPELQESQSAINKPTVQIQELEGARRGVKPAPEILCR